MGFYLNSSAKSLNNRVADPKGSPMQPVDPNGSRGIPDDGNVPRIPEIGLQKQGRGVPGGPKAGLVVEDPPVPAMSCIPLRILSLRKGKFPIVGRQIAIPVNRHRKQDRSIHFENGLLQVGKICVGKSKKTGAVLLRIAAFDRNICFIEKVRQADLAVA